MGAIGPLKPSQLAYTILDVLNRSPSSLTRENLADVRDVTDVGRDSTTISLAVAELLAIGFAHEPRRGRGLTITHAGLEYLGRFADPAESQ